MPRAAVDNRHHDQSQHMTGNARSSSDVLLEIDGLTVEFASTDAPVQAVNNVSLTVRRGETLGIIGESGSGKSATAMSVLRLLPEPPARVLGGRILLNGDDLLAADHRQLREVRGRRISMIFQDPTTSLHPSYTIGSQLSEAIRVHQQGLSTTENRQRCVELLTSVGIAPAEERMNQYPHEFSGGMRQRCMIAMAIANQPDVIIADEPTTALDVTIQAEILDLLRVVKRETQAAVIFITHDLRVVAQISDRVAVMYAGSVVESGPAQEVLHNPQHPYTAALLRSLPALHERAERQVSIQGSPPDPTDLPAGCSFQPRCDIGVGETICRTTRPVLVSTNNLHESACHFSSRTSAVEVDLKRSSARHAKPISDAETDRVPVLQVKNLEKRFSLRTGLFSTQRESVAVNHISFDVMAGKTLALVGESGSGKSTTAKMILRLHKPTSGEILFDGIDLAKSGGKQLRDARRKLQMVFQDPFGSLNPRLTARQLVAEPLKIQGRFDSDSRERVDLLLDRVRLNPNQWNSRPVVLSGGQRQRIAIARALVLDSRFLVLDEAVSALDVSIQAQILNLLADLQTELGLTYLFISHDLAVVRQLADHVAVMFAGRIVEIGTADDIFHSAKHPYTRALLAAIPGADPARQLNELAVSSADVGIKIAEQGCPYRLRCPIRQDVCSSQIPPLESIDNAPHKIACHLKGIADEVSGP